MANLVGQVARRFVGQLPTALWDRLATCGRLLIGLPAARAISLDNLEMRRLVGQPILAAAAFQAAFSRPEQSYSTPVGNQHG